MRRDILGAIIRTIADEGRTVLFSSHLLAEVERVSDEVAMIKSGRVLFCDSLDRIKQTHARLTLPSGIDISLACYSRPIPIVSKDNIFPVDLIGF